METKWFLGRLHNVSEEHLAPHHRQLSAIVDDLKQLLQFSLLTGVASPTVQDPDIFPGLVTMQRFSGGYSLRINAGVEPRAADSSDESSS